MSSPRVMAATRPGDSLASVLATNRVVRNTFWLLALTLAFGCRAGSRSQCSRSSTPTLFFIVGLVFCLVLQAIVFNRVIFHHPLPAKLALTF